METMKLSRTVYSCTFKESDEVFNKVISKPAFATEFHQPWATDKMKVSDDFFKSWMSWTSKVLTGIDGFEFKYPTAGSSEGVREVIYQAALNKRTVVVLDGEYEGYAAYTNAANGQLVVVNRDNFFVEIQTLPEDILFVVSNPNSLDGNLISEIDTMFSALAMIRPAVEVLIDLTYVGVVDFDNYKIDLSHPNIKYACFSLSKPFGVYYHRIGGMFSKKPLLGLYGNSWFKNITSLLYGTELMNSFSLTELPKKYKQVALDVLAEHAPELIPSHVWLLGHLNTSDVEILAKYKEFTRTPNNIRVCLTPEIWNRIYV